MALKRRNKPNAILVGNPGVGKTAIVEELAQLLSKNKIPGLEGKRIYELDISSVVGGTKYRGEFEEKLKKIIKNVSDDGNAIIFIDEIHNIIKAGGAEGAIDASNILKPYLSRGDIQIIGATTVDEYHTIFEKDKALNRRFQIIYVDPSNKDETLNILNTLKPIYEDYYKLKIADNLTNYIVEIAEEFIPNMSFPDKAIDILDNSCVLAKNELTKENINKMVEKTYNVSISKDKKALLIKEKLEEEILGQNSAIEKIYKEMLKIEFGLVEEDKPLTTMLFVGPSGVGKTQSARIIAKEYYKVKDCFIKLDMATYKDVTSLNKLIGSAPGYSNHDEMPAFIKKIKMHPNSLVLLDEIDKMASDYKGDPTSAMLEVLDPEQNSMFSDNYIEEPYDLSQVLFIATANDLGGIPGPLRDRLEIIELSSYTEQEKLMIAKDHLIKKELKNHGLTDEQLTITDDALMYIIRHYTREAGVRQLERLIAAICRKSVLKILKKTTDHVAVEVNDLEELLGKAPFDHTKKQPKPQVGVVTGLAWTQFGGDILPIEVNHFKGSGKFIVTGQLGDVMKESASIALDYLKAHADKYSLKDIDFDKQDIHIHVPEGAVKKDGPSAGVTLTTAIYSAFTQKPVRDDVAMTGEVTLTGNVLPIGGLKEKSISAHRSGIHTIIIPKDNAKDIDDIPESVRNDLTIITADHIDTVLENALVK